MRRTVIFAISLILTFSLQGDWKKEIINCFKKAHDYSRITGYLEKTITGISSEEKPYAIIILGFAYKELGNPVYEEKWITHYFENHEVTDPDFSFLPPLERVKIYEYISHWKRLFPKIEQISINPRSMKIPFFLKDQILMIDLHIRAPSSLSVKNSKMENLFTGYLNKGTNTIGIPLSDEMKSMSSQVLRMEMKTGAVEIIRHITLSTVYRYPDDIIFNPAGGTIAIRGKTFKEETSAEKYMETIKEFDRNHFMKKGLLPLGVGCAAFLLRQIVIHPQRIRDDISPPSRAFLYAVDETCLVFSIGISVSGVIQMLKSTRHQKIERERMVQHPEAIRYNTEIRNLIREYRKKVYIQYQLTCKK